MREQMLIDMECRNIPAEIIEASPAIALRVTGVRDGWKIVFVSANIASFGYDAGRLAQDETSYLDLIHPEDRGELAKVAAEFEDLGYDQFTINYRLKRRDGEYVWLSDASRVVRDDDGRISHVDSVLTDYTQTREHLERLREGYRQQAVINAILQEIHEAETGNALQVILDKAGDFLDVSRVIFCRNSRDHQHARVTHQWVNPKCGRLPQTLGAYRYCRDLPELDKDLTEYGYRIVVRGRSADKTTARLAAEGAATSALFEVTVQGERYGFLRFDDCEREREWGRDTVAFLHNVARLAPAVVLRERNEKMIRDLAVTDQLTGLRNRRHLESRLGEAITQAKRIGLEGYLLFIDMDDFKLINDAYGHDYGDAILREVSEFLLKTFGGNNRVYRFGGDEFVILIEDAADEEIGSVIDRLSRRGRLPWRVGEKNLYCTMSIGVVRFPADGGDGREAVKNADLAMYEAKKSGKNTFTYYTGSLYRDSLERVEMENAMRTCIDNGFRGFEVHYQPLADLNRRIIGAEALVRWTQGGRRMSPAEFIPLSEYLGLIVPLGDHVLERALGCCRAVNERHPDFFISVNASLRQFRQAGYLDRTLGILGESGVNFRNVYLEITEGMAMHDLQNLRSIGEGLRRSGVGISMDDFGTGYSSLGNMRDLPLDVVKIDRMFVRDIATDAYSESFIRLITDLVHSMRRRVCVEGVESEGQFEFCRGCGVDYVQGFYLWRPMEEGDFLELMGVG